MYSCHSPVKSFSGVPVSANTTSPIKSKVAISLNGLFGEPPDHEDQPSISLSSHSPISGSLSHGRTTLLSPSKSPNSALNFGAQPVLLSELADCLPYNGSSGGPFHGATLCSYISQYDNSRCTNLAAATCGVGKSYCRNHLELARPIEVNVPTYAPSSNTTVSSSQPKNPPTKSTMYVVPQSSTLPRMRSFQADNRHVVNHKCNPGVGVLRSQGSVVTASPTSGINVTDGTHHGHSNVVFPLSYVAAPARLVGRTSGKPQKQLHAQAGNARNNLSKRVPAKAMAGLKHVNSGTGTTALQMDGDVLQAFIDFLGQNQSNRLGVKQQMDLLKSLNFVVAPAPNAKFQQAQLVNLGNNGVKVPTQSQYSVVYSSNEQLQKGDLSYPSQNNFNQQRPLAELQTLNNPALTGENVMLSMPTMKRKNSSMSFSPSDCKRTKKIANAPSSLQHLSPRELDERVLETMASVGGISSLQKQVFAKPALSCKSKSVSMVKSKKTLKKLHKKEVSVPSVQIAMHSHRHGNLLNSKLSSEALKEYVSLHIDDSLKTQPLFSIGPLCEDTDAGVCRCTPAQKSFFQYPIKKQRSSKNSSSKPKLCWKCTKISPISHQSFADHVLKTTLSKQDKLTAALSRMDLLHDNREFIFHSTASRSVCGAMTSDFESASIHCRHLSKSAKYWKNMFKKETKAIRLLLDSAQDNVKETRKVLTQMGSRPISCSRRRGRCAALPSQCVLTDRTGWRCQSTALPLASYCRQHILHSDHQQLYKLNASMSVVADVYPDPPTVRPRKKTKLPPLSKRKKRKKKINPAKLAKANSKTILADSKASETIIDVETSGKTNENFRENSPPSIRNNSSFGKLDTISSQMSSSNSNQSIPENAQTVSDNLPVTVDEESNSGILEAFSLDGTGLLSDVMPEMFSDLDLFNYKNGEVLDNALLLAGASDTDFSDKINIDRFSLEDLGENGMFFSPSNSNGNDPDTNSSPSQKDAEKISEDFLRPSSGGSHRESAISINETPPTFSSSLGQSACSDATSPSFSSANIPPIISSSASNAIETTKWSSSLEKNSQGSEFEGSGTGIGNLSSSLESSFADDLNELEGVIQSLQNERDEADFRDVASHRPLDPDEFTNNLARELSLDVEKQRFASTLPSEIINQPVCNSWSNSSYFTSTTMQSLPAANMITSQSNHVLNTKITQYSPMIGQSSMSSQPIIETSAKSRVRGNSDVKAEQKPRTSKKTKKHTPKKRQSSVVVPSLPITHILPSLKDNPGNLQHYSPTNAPNFKATTTEAVKQSTSGKLTAKQTPKLSADFENSKTMKKLKNAPSGSLSQMPPVYTLNSSVRMQPKTLSGNVLCATGKVNNTNITNQNMVLIPINAVVRSANQSTVQASNQSLGIAFAIPAQAAFSNNTGAVIPIRGSAVLAGAHNAQQLLILGSSQAHAGPIGTHNLSFTQAQQTTNTTIKTTQQPKNGPDSTKPSQTVVNIISTKSVGTAGNPASVLLTSCPSYSVPTQTNTSYPLKQTFQNSVSNPAATSVNKTPSFSTTSCAGKNQTNAKSDASVVFSPVVEHTRNSTQADTSNITSQTKQASNVQVKSIPSKSSGSTVHWNQTMEGPGTPLPQPRLYGTLGGQTANMLYCRRISPSLNNSQQVIVGRLGSLGRIGLSRLSVAEQDKNSVSPTQPNLPAQQSTRNAALSNAEKKETSSSHLSSPGFIQLSPSANKSCKVSQPTVNPVRTESDLLPDGRQTVSSQSVACGTMVSAFNASVISSSTSSALSKCVESTKTSLQAPIVVTTTTVRHNSRKSDHTTMLKDPDLSETHLEVTAANKISDCENVLGGNIRKSNLKQSANDLAVMSSYGKTKDDEKSILNGSKASRRATILRKKR